MKRLLLALSLLSVALAPRIAEAQLGCQNYYNSAGTLLGCAKNFKGGAGMTCTISGGTVTCTAGAGSTTIAGAYSNGASAADETPLITAALGPVIFKANAAAIGTLVAAQTSTAANLFSVSDAGTITIGANVNETASAGTGAFDWSGGSGVFKTTTGAVTIGSGAVSITGATTFAANIGISTTAGTGAFDFSNGTGAFSTSTGTNTIGGATVFAANKGVTVTAGTSAFDFSGGTGAFKTSTGAVTIGNGAVSITGNVTLAANVNETASAGTSAFDWSAGTGVFKTPTGNHTFGSATWSVPANTTITGSVSATNTTAITYAGDVADGSGSIAHVFNNKTSLANASAKLVAFQNNGTEKLAIVQTGELRTPAGIQFLAKSGQTAFTDDAYVLDTTNNQDGNYVMSFKTNGVNYIRFNANSVTGDILNFYNPSTGAFLSGILATIAGNLQFNSTGGLAFLPGADAGDSLGNSSTRWKNTFSRAYYSIAQTPAFSATMNIDPSLGEQCAVTLTANLTNWTISAPTAAGQRFQLTFIQDATGSRLIGTPPAAIKWLPSTYLGTNHTAPTLTTTANKSDVFFFVTYDGTNWSEVNRNMNN